MIVGAWPPARLNQHIVVKSMQRFANFQHHIIGRIHDVVDRAHAGQAQPALDPVRAGANLARPG